MTEPSGANHFWIPRTTEEQRVLVEAVRAIKDNTIGQAVEQLRILLDDLESHTVALRRLFGCYQNLSDVQADTEVFSKLGAILEVESSGHVDRFGVDPPANPGFEYKWWRFVICEQLSELYQAVSLDRALIYLADAIRRNDDELKRWYSELCRVEHAPYRAMHTLHQWSRPKSRARRANTGYFKPDEQCELFHQTPGSVKARVSKIESTLKNATASKNTEIADPNSFLAPGKRYHVNAWRPLAPGRKDRNL